MSKIIAIPAAAMLLGGCQFGNFKEDSEQPEVFETANAATLEEQSELSLPEGTECDDRDVFFAKLMNQGYERVVTGYGGQVSPPYNIAVWRSYDADNRLVLTISNIDRACKIIGMHEFSAPPG